MAGLLNAKQLVDGSVTPNKLSERYLQVNEQGEVFGNLIVNGDTTLTETATYKGSEIATQADLYGKGGINDLINDLDEKKQDNLIAGENIQIAPDGVTISSSTKVAGSDRVLTYDAAGLKANISLVVDGNHIRVEGKTDGNGEPYVLGEFNVLQSQIIDNVYIENGHLFITFIVDGDPGKEKVDIDLSEFIDIYEGSDYIDINGQQVSLKYSEVRDKLIKDGMASTGQIPVDYVNLGGTQTITGVKTFISRPYLTNTANSNAFVIFSDLNSYLTTSTGDARYIPLTGTAYPTSINHWTGRQNFNATINYFSYRPYVGDINSTNNQVALRSDIPQIPTNLPNPNAITFTGAATGTYNGSSALTVNIPAAPNLSGYVTTSSLNNTLANYSQIGHTHNYASTSHTHYYAGSDSPGGAANTAIKLHTQRTINGTYFDGSTNITTANWGTSRDITIGNSKKSVNGSGDVSWSLLDIGAAASSHTHNYAATEHTHSNYLTSDSKSVPYQLDLIAGGSLTSAQLSNVRNAITSGRGINILTPSKVVAASGQIDGTLTYLTFISGYFITRYSISSAGVITTTEKDWR